MRSAGAEGPGLNLETGLDMALNLKQNLSQKMMQRLSPQQVQLLKLMQVTTMDLEQRIKDELQNNPALEEGDGGKAQDEVSISQLGDGSEDVHVNDDDSASDARVDSVSEADADRQETGSDDYDVNDYIDRDKDDYAYKLKAGNYRDPDEEYENPVRFKQGFQEQLRNELGMLPLTSVQRQIGEVIIGNLDGDGYLQRSVEAMVNDMAFTLNLMVTPEQVDEVLKMVQGMEPWGIGGRDLRECLMIQVRNRMTDAKARHAGKEELAVLQNAYRILDKCFEEFVKRHYGRMADRLRKSEDELREAMELIRTLNPKPGQSGAESASPDAPTLIPDFYLSNEDGRLVLLLNAKNDPDLKVSPAYEHMLEEYGAQQQRNEAVSKDQESVKYRKTREAAQFVMQKIDSARWFMEMIRQRKTTMLRIMQAVVDYQHDYFLEGDIAKLKPMRLKDIAEKVGMDISTVSRVINNKYIQTHFGTFLVKEFFSQSTENEEGEEISTSQVKAALQHLVDKEDKRSPLTDDELESALRQQGFVVARRTVAKYREGLGIPIARMRKQL